MRLSKIEDTKRFPCRSNAGPSRKTLGPGSTCNQGYTFITGRLASEGGKGTILDDIFDPAKAKEETVVKIPAIIKPITSLLFILLSFPYSLS